MTSYILTNKAIEDLSDIWNYTFDEWSETQADKYYSLLLDFCQDLAEDAKLAKKYPDIADDIFGGRIWRHIIFFRRPKADRIEISRILHSSMDLKIGIDE